MLLADGTATTLFLMGLMVIVVVAMRAFRRSSRTSPRTKQHAAHEPSAERHAPTPPQFVRWEVQMHELARDLSGQLDTKIVILEQLVCDAREQVERLQAVIQQAEHLQRLGSDGGGDFDRAEVAPRRPLPEPRYDDDELNWLARGSGRVTPPIVGPPVDSAQQDDRYREIIRLAQAGYSNAAIAHEVAAPLGEVELILSLRGKG